MWLHHGTDVDEDTLREVIKLRMATLHGKRGRLRGLRANSPLTGNESFEDRKRELRNLFVGTLCIEALKPLREEVALHLAHITVILSHDKKVRDYKLTGLLSGWEIPYNRNYTQECSLNNFDLGRMEPVDLKKATYKCDLCGFHWGGNKRPLYSKVGCCCNSYGTSKKNTIKPGTGISNPSELDQD
jgi:hypothetical protein